MKFKRGVLLCVKSNQKVTVPEDEIWKVHANIVCNIEFPGGQDFKPYSSFEQTTNPITIPPGAILKPSDNSNRFAELILFGLAFTAD